MPFNFTGETSAVLQIGNGNITLEGKFLSEGKLTDIFELSYKSKSLDDSICLGNIIKTSKDLIVGALQLHHSDFADMAKKAITLLPRIDNTPEEVRNFFSTLKSILEDIGELNDTIAEDINQTKINQKIEVYLRGLVLRFSTNKTTPSEISIWLEFKFEGCTIFNISLLTAGIKFSFKKENE